MAKNGKFNIKQILLILSIIGPGIITSTVDNDAGGITTYSVAGANFGYDLLWTLIPITILLIIVQEMAARMGAVTGKGLADLIRENFGVKITFFILTALIFANFAVTISEFAGIAAAGELFGISKYIFVPICAVFVWFLIMKLNYRNIEKIFLSLVLFYLCYIISGVIGKPDWGEVGRSMIAPSFSAISPIYLVVVVGIIGTTITPWMQFYLQSSIVEKGIKIKDYKYSRWDVIVGSIFTDVVAFFIIVAVAATLFQSKIPIESASDAAIALAPVAGKNAALLFGIGLFGAAFFGAFILPLATAFHTCEGIGWESGINKKFREAPQFYIIITLLITFAAGIILIPNTNLIRIMFLSQVINGIILPFILIGMLILINNKSIMGSYTNSRFYNVVVWGATGITVMITIAMLVTSFMPGVTI